MARSIGSQELTWYWDGPWGRISHSKRETGFIGDRLAQRLGLQNWSWAVLMRPILDFCFLYLPRWLIFTIKTWETPFSSISFYSVPRVENAETGTPSRPAETRIHLFPNPPPRWLVNTWKFEKHHSWTSSTLIIYEKNMENLKTKTKLLDASG